MGHKAWVATTLKQQMQWAVTGTPDAEGDTHVNVVGTFPCRWENAHVVTMNGKGESVTSSARVFTQAYVMPTIPDPDDDPDAWVDPAAGTMPEPVSEPVSEPDPVPFDPDAWDDPAASVVEDAPLAEPDPNVFDPDAWNYTPQSAGTDPASDSSAPEEPTAEEPTPDPAAPVVPRRVEPDDLIVFNGKDHRVVTSTHLVDLDGKYTHTEILI